MSLGTILVHVLVNEDSRHGYKFHIQQFFPFTHEHFITVEIVCLQAAGNLLFWFTKLICNSVIILSFRGWSNSGGPSCRLQTKKWESSRQTNQPGKMQHHSRGVAGEHVLRLHNKQDAVGFWVRRRGEFHGHKCLLIVFYRGKWKGGGYSMVTNVCYVVLLKNTDCVPI